MKRLTYLSLRSWSWPKQQIFMTKDSRVSEDIFWMPFGKLARTFAGILNGGLSLKRPFAAAVFIHFLTGCCIANYLIAYKLLPCIIPAAGLMVGKTA